MIFTVKYIKKKLLLNFKTASVKSNRKSQARAVTYSGISAARMRIRTGA